MDFCPAAAGFAGGVDELDELKGFKEPVETPKDGSPCDRLDKPSPPSITIDTYDLNLEEKPRKSIHYTKNIVIFCIDDDMRFPTIRCVCRISNSTSLRRSVRI